MIRLTICWHFAFIFVLLARLPLPGRAQTTPPIGSSGQLSLQLNSPPLLSPTPNIPLMQFPTPPPDKPAGVRNLKELAAPIKLVYADIIMDGGRSLCGKLRGSNGKEFWFFLRLGPNVFDSTSRDGLYVGYMSGNIPESALARFESWTDRDFCLVLETAIRSQFYWDRVLRRLVPYSLADFDEVPSEVFDGTKGKKVLWETFGASGARRLLRYAEGKLQREHSYMQ